MLRATFATVARTSAVRTATVTRPMGVARRFYSAHAEDESYEALAERYVKFFDGVEISLNSNASRRVNDYATAVRVFEGLKEKVENEKQYQQYLEELAPLKNELGVLTKEELNL
ncbi:unnamed protein product [Absidia cylindrospora]